MIESDGWVEADGVEMGLRLNSQQCISVGKDGIGRVMRRTPGAALKGSNFREETPITFEVTPSRRPFIAAEGLDGGGGSAIFSELIEGE